MNGPSSTKAWTALQDQSKKFQSAKFRLTRLFDADSSRFDKFSAQHGELLLDYSKNYLDDETKSLLLDLAEQCSVPQAIRSMFAGEAINTTENRPAHHVALRNSSLSSQQAEIENNLNRMASFISKVENGELSGFENSSIKQVINLGIGGSDLGPAMVTTALDGFDHTRIKIHFVSNIDPSHINSTLMGLSAEETLFIISSKSFTTLETQQNALRAKQWLLENGVDSESVSNHFIAISNNIQAVVNFGVRAENIFPLWDWVGGRYSLWSAIGLPIALSIGMGNFRELLAGARSMDKHFLESEMTENLPVLLALLTVWYTAFFNCHSSVVAPYSQRLELLPSYLQQLYMESLGKFVDKQGNPTQTNTGEALWGTTGSNGQHSYFQLLHQGKENIPVDFIAIAKPHVNDFINQEQLKQHQHLLSNCFSQSLALMNGNDGDGDQHRWLVGNKPSNTILMNTLNPHSLGSLIALYEHKVYVQSVIWNINAFDQWGVELGKNLSKELFTAFSSAADVDKQDLDSSTSNLIKHSMDWNE
jgi:glucose-6-phosphate isomerase